MIEDTLKESRGFHSFTSEERVTSTKGEQAMTVKELIDKLKTFAPDTEVLIEGRDSTGEYYDTI